MVSTFGFYGAIRFNAVDQRAGWIGIEVAVPAPTRHSMAARDNADNAQGTRSTATLSPEGTAERNTYH